MRITRNLFTTKKLGATALIAALSISGFVASGAHVAQAAEVSTSAIGVDAPLASIVRPSGLNPADVTPDNIAAFVTEMNEIREANGLAPIPADRVYVGQGDWSDLSAEHATDAADGTPKADAHEGALALNEVAWRGYFSGSAPQFDGSDPATGWWESLPHREILYQQDSEAAYGGPHGENSVFVFNMTEVDGIAGTAGEGFTYLDARGAWITFDYMAELGLNAVSATEVDPTLADGGPVETEPGETEPGETEPGETEPAETEPVETEPSETIPTETEPTEPVESTPAETPAETEPASGEGTEPEATESGAPETEDALAEGNSNADDSGNLAQTGAEGLLWALGVGTALMLAGAGVVLRRRRTA